jgi:hypothetical protein
VLKQVLLSARLKTSYRQHFWPQQAFPKSNLPYFIDLPSIFRDKRVTNSVPLYYKNSEIPIIFYK